jgi:hypothetical protein
VRAVVCGGVRAVCVQPDTNIQDNTWYNSANPESKVISGWTKLLQRYKDQWNVFAADIKVRARRTFRAY